MDERKPSIPTPLAGMAPLTPEDEDNLAELFGVPRGSVTLTGPFDGAPPWPRPLRWYHRLNAIMRWRA